MESFANRENEKVAGNYNSCAVLFTTVEERSEFQQQCFLETQFPVSFYESLVEVFLPRSTLNDAVGRILYLSTHWPPLEDSNATYVLGICNIIPPHLVAQPRF